MTVPPRLRVIGPGRAGRSLATALSRAGWQVVGLLGRGDDVTGAASGCDLLVVATADAAVAEVAAAVSLREVREIVPVPRAAGRS